MHKTGKGVVCYISNFSYLSDPSFVVMRQRFLEGFDKLWFDSLNGDSRETGKLTPEGKPDPSIFSTRYNREGIRVGTAVGLMVRKERPGVEPTVRFRQFWGVDKRDELVKSLSTRALDDQYEEVKPSQNSRLSYRPLGSSNSYRNWPAISELSSQKPFTGFLEGRQGSLINIDRDALEKRMRMFYDPTVDWAALAAIETGLTRDAARFDARRTREKVLNTEQFNSDRIRRYTIRPFDTRWCYYSPVRSLWNEPRPALWAQCWSGNQFLVTRVRSEKNARGSPMYFSSGLVDYQSMARNASAIPLRTTSAKIATEQDGFFGDKEDGLPTANLSEEARAYLAELSIADPDSNAETASLIWMHALAIGYSPLYLSENADGVRRDWPRIPLPDSKEALITSAELGRQVATLLDTESPVAGVTSETIRPELRNMVVISREGGGTLNPDAGDLALTMGWGHKSRAGVVMPGRGKAVEREYTQRERAGIEAGAVAQNQLAEEGFARLGETTFDIYLNGVAYWKNIPANVWSYTIGGYQVIKKWLSYRERDVLSRPLTIDEVREITGMARRIAAILLLEPQLDANYRAISEACYPWSSLDS